MMHIKLPWKRVRYACALLRTQHYDDIARLCKHHAEEMVRWGNNNSVILDKVTNPMPVRADLTTLTKARDLMDDMVEMCDVSKGDVFVSPQMWKTIRRYYKK